MCCVTLCYVVYDLLSEFIYVAMLFMLCWLLEQIGVVIFVCSVCFLLDLLHSFMLCLFVSLTVEFVFHRVCHRVMLRMFCLRMS